MAHLRQHCIECPGRAQQRERAVGVVRHEGWMEDTVKRIYIETIRIWLAQYNE